MTTGGQTAAIELRDIVKRFPGVVANDGVNLTVMPGTIHAIVGENGAGKSTLMKILYGAQPADEGRILVNGLEQRFRSPRDAIDIGIGMVFQHFMLADNLTVWENLILGDEPGTSWRLDIGAARKRILELGRNYGLQVDPDELVADLGVGEQPGRDPEGALPQRPHHHPGRADSRARASGGGGAVRVAAKPGEPRRDDHLHLAQARRGVAGG